VTLSRVVRTPVGPLGILVAGGLLQEIRWLEAPPEDRIGAAGDPLAWEVERQLQAYFEEPRWRFDLPMAPRGTRFQRRVWERLGGIPPGTTCGYGELARELGTGARALANACRINPFPIVVPCHRVVAVGGLGGYAGQRKGRLVRIKRWLLAHEA
jgi:methylated-DNA-[protein]-cysteine S-methyltransferase